MAHASEKFRYSTRDYRVQRILHAALQKLDIELKFKDALVGRELGKLTKLLEKRKEEWR